MKTENEIISEFMGFLISDGNDGVYHKGTFYHPELFTHFQFVEIKYHSSWDWLMPVVEKIEGIGQPVVIDELGIHLTQARGPMRGKGHAIIFNKSDGSKFEITYKAVVEFIKWYNQQKS